MDTGALLFGIVVGWVTYYTLRHEATHAVSDIASVISAVGSGAVIVLFKGSLFESYAIGLALGFFGYLVVFIIIAVLGQGGKAWSIIIGGPSAPTVMFKRQ